MLSDTIRDNMSAATMLAGDLDFQPLISALVQAGMWTILRYDPSNTNDDLISSADASYPITFGTIHTWGSDTFQNSHPLPRGVSTSSTDAIVQVPPIRAGNGASGDTIRLYLKGEEYIITFPDISNQGNYFYYRHTNQRLLEDHVRVNVKYDFTWD